MGNNSGPKVSSAVPGQPVTLLSNHFRFQTLNRDNHIYIYSIDFGAFSDKREDKRDALQSVSDKLKSVFGVWTCFGNHLFSPSRIDVENIFAVSANGKVGEIQLKPFQFFSMDEPTNELRKKAHLASVMNFITKIVKHSLYD
jgi:hypothetical protein